MKSKKKTSEKTEFEDEDMRMALGKLRDKIMQQKSVTDKFKTQIQNLIARKESEKLLERIQKGSGYYLGFLNECLKELLIHLEYVKLFTRTKTYRNLLEEIDQFIAKKTMQIRKAEYICRCVMENRQIERKAEFKISHQKNREEILAKAKAYVRENPKNHLTKTGRKRKKSTKGETYQTTFSMYKEGLSPMEIAEKRSLAPTTIEGHLALGVETGEIEIGDFIDENEFQKIATFFKGDLDSSLSPIYEKANGKYSYGKLRMVRAEILRNEKKDFTPTI